MRYPEFLKDNGTIGFVAPSFGCATEPYRSSFMNALEKWKNMGYATKLGPNCLVDKGIGISNKPEECGKELNEFYKDADTDVLISCGGGELMCEVIPYMDLEMVRNSRPKWYMGYSDNTNFTFLSATICDTAAIYGPCAGTFGMEPWHESLTDTWELLCGRTNKVHSYKGWERDGFKDEEHPLLPYNITEETVIRRIPEERIEVEGRLLGGCMDCLVNFLGTEFDHVKEFNARYKEDGIIWFLEACDLNVMSIRRALWQMKHAGWFENVKAFLIGRPVCHGDEMFGIDHQEAAYSMLKEYGVPVIMDLDIGHLPPMMPIICGSTAKVKCDASGFEMEYTFK